MKNLIFFLFLTFSFNVNAGFDYAPVTKKQEEYICNEVTDLKNKIDDFYCSSSQKSLDLKGCDYNYEKFKACSVERTSYSVYQIDLLINNQESDEDDTSKSNLDVENVSNSSDLSVGIKCINSISNEWHCGVSNQGYRFKELSDVNELLRKQLYKELFDRASASVSKI
ncbi:hypothetical protein [Bermanella sp. R86510]|uniref:hypothetical protein n=1 Tax=unclassified Bermanella TaxID=2627862 RepID=UPI0037CB66BF